MKMNNKVLIAFATKCGATEDTAQQIAETLPTFFVELYKELKRIINDLKKNTSISTKTMLNQDEQNPCFYKFFVD